jgi:hypothetical protein
MFNNSASNFNYKYYNKWTKPLVYSNCDELSQKDCLVFNPIESSIENEVNNMDSEKFLEIQHQKNRKNITSKYDELKKQFKELSMMAIQENEDYKKELQEIKNKKKYIISGSLDDKLDKFHNTSQLVKKQMKNDAAEVIYFTGSYINEKEERVFQDMKDVVDEVKKDSYKAKNALTKKSEKFINETKQACNEVPKGVKLKIKKAKEVFSLSNK